MGVFLGLGAILALAFLASGQENKLELKPFTFKRTANPTLYMTQTAKGSSLSHAVTPPICPTGFLYLHSGKCVKWDPRGNMAKCDEGWVKDSVGRCSLYEEPSCPEGTEKVGSTRCVTKKCSNADEEIVNGVCFKRCEPGKKRYYSNLCISEDLVCPRTFTRRDSQCVLNDCPSNMNKTSSSCKTECPTGFSLQGDTCYNMNGQPCPYGYKQEGTTCVLESCPGGLVLIGSGCVATGYVPCPEGYDVTTKAMCQKCTKRVNGKCYEDVRQCPSDWYQLNDDRCVKVCPSNMAVLGGKCKSLDMDPCSKGTIFMEGKGCVKGETCPDGYRKIGQTCVKLPNMECDTFTLNGKCLENCPEGYVEYNHQCLKQQAGKCPENFLRLAGTYCVKSCPEGYTAVAKGCYPFPGCSDNEKYFMGKCSATCPAGSVQSTTEENSCTLHFSCPTGQLMAMQNSMDLKPGCAADEAQCSERGYIADAENKFCRGKDDCKNTNFIFGQFCLPECPLGYQSVGRVCKKSPDDKCSKGVYHEGKCLSQCPAGFVPQSGKCISMPPPEVLVKCGVNMYAKGCAPGDKGCIPQCVCREGFTKVEGREYCRPQSKPCAVNNTLEVLFILDASDNVAESEFNLMKMYLMEAATHLFSVKPTLRIGVVIFGPDDAELVYLGKINEECHCIDFFTTLTRKGGNGTDLITALFLGRELVLSQCNGARIAIPRHIFVVVKKESIMTNKVQRYLATEVKEQEKSGNRLSFITIGNGDISIPQNVYTLKIDNLDKLMNNSKKLAEIICGDFVCPKGYAIIDGKCVNENECAGFDACHKSARCVDTPGSFYCLCPYGQVYIDNEVGCGSKNDTCKNKQIDPKEICNFVTCIGNNSYCSTSNGEAYCVCPKGYEYHKKLGCVDVDECKKNPCLLKGSCKNTHGSFRCFCEQDGFYYHPHFGCIDVDECTVLVEPCSGNGKCTNTMGSYDCSCDAGYEYIKSKGCVDINECKTRNPCTGENVECKNLPGSFECRCPAGYEYVKDKCQDIDECVTIGYEKACGKGVMCVNTEPGYECKCQTGFIYNNVTRACDVNTDSGLKQKRADLIFLVDGGKKMTEKIHGQVREMVSNIIRDYRDKSSSVLQRVSGIAFGGENEVNRIFTNLTDDEAVYESRKLPYMDGSAKQSEALKEARNVYQNFGQVNATRLVFLVTASDMSTDPVESRAIKEQVDYIKKEGRLIIIMIGSELKRESWLRVFTQEEIEKYVIVVQVSMITTIHSLIYKNTDTLITCPDGFIFLDNVCQYKTKHTKYCIFDDKFYAINSTWTSNCVLHRCTEAGVQMTDIKCLGIDGDCYAQGEPHPCNIKGENRDYCTCHVIGSTSNIVAGRFDQVVKRVFVLGGFNQSSITLIGEGSCTFPFKYKGHWFYTCTDDRSSYLWCGKDRIYEQGRYMKCQEVSRPCVVDGITHNHEEEWVKECNNLYCKAGSVSITPRCMGDDGKCYPVGQFFSCNIEKQHYKECMCLVDAYGYGWLKAIGRASDKLDNHTSEFAEFCEQGTTGMKHKFGDVWKQDCFKLTCDKGETKILEKKCMADDESCHDIGKSGFECTIRAKKHANCTCEEHEKNIVLTATSEGKVHKEVKSSGSLWISSSKVRTAGSLSETNVAGTITGNF